MLDSDAVRATQRLISRGFEAYLVGGCVRDHLLGHSPKDYDIATVARPQQVKRCFPHNCRIIGRRFKLAHLHFQQNTKILEVSTFRRTPQTDEAPEGDLLITRDNEFGDAMEDALRRDFTVNALFLDPTTDRIIDYANGLPDLHHKIIRTIGDPRVRFREDPVRILRAAKFAGRLGFEIEAETKAAMAEVAGDLVRAAPPRVLEEILRLLRSGHALDSFQLLRDVGALRPLVPLVAGFLASAPQEQRVRFWRLLEALDHSVHDGRLPTNATLLAVLFHGAVEAHSQRRAERSPTSIAEELLGPLAQTLRLSRRDAGALKRICAVQHRFLQDEATAKFHPAAFAHSPYFDEALALFELRAMAEDLPAAAVQRWRELFGTAPAAPVDFDRADASDADDAEQPMPVAGPASDDDEGGRRRRRRRRRRRGGDREASAVDADRPRDDAPEPQHDDILATEGDGEAAGTAPGDEATEVEEAGVDAGERTATDEQPAAEPAEHGTGEPGRRRRRRRGRRGRGRDRDHDRQRFPDGEAPSPHGDPIAPHDGAAPSDDQPQRDPEAPAPAQRQQRRGGGEPRGKSRRQQRREERQRHRERRHGSDVDVVPRHRDRRGKVEVIEPPPLDLSAFEVELDPKRVPTFGSIVEGQRKKKRSRLPDEGIDDYKPPPPPGGHGGPGAPPPPPPPSGPDDSFGDW